MEWWKSSGDGCSDGCTTMWKNVLTSIKNGKFYVYFTIIKKNTEREKLNYPKPGIY